MRRLAFAALVLVAACSRKDPSPTRGAPSPASSELAQPASIERSVETFGLQLLRALGDDKSNSSFVVSPVSVATSVAYIRDGAAGRTKAEAEAMLRAPTKRDASDFFDLSRGGYFLRSDHVFVDDQLTVAPAFAQLAAKMLSTAPLRSSPREAATKINLAVSEASKGAFSSLVPGNQIDARSRVALASTFEVSAAWQEPFNDQTSSLEWFHPIGAADVRVPTMRSTLGQQRRVVAADYDAVDLSLDTVLGLLIVAPKGDFHAFARTMDAARLTAIGIALQNGNVSLQLPKFEVATQKQLKPLLEQLGLKRAFVPDAELGAMATSADGGLDNVFVTDVFHGAKIVVDEHGIGAKKPREWNMPKMAQTVSMRIDRPFLFFLHHRRTGLLILVGRWMGPI